MFLLTLGFACVYMYGLAQIEFNSHRTLNYRTLLITVLFIRTDRLSCINMHVIIRIKVELGESQRGTLE